MSDFDQLKRFIQEATSKRIGRPLVPPDLDNLKRVVDSTLEAILEQTPREDFRVDVEVDKEDPTKCNCRIVPLTPLGELLVEEIAKNMGRSK